MFKIARKIGKIVILDKIGTSRNHKGNLGGVFKIFTFYFKTYLWFYISIRKLNIMILLYIVTMAHFYLQNIWHCNKLFLTLPSNILFNIIVNLIAYG